MSKQDFALLFYSFENEMPTPRASFDELRRDQVYFAWIGDALRTVFLDDVC